MNFIVLDEWNEATIEFAKNSVIDLVVMYSPGLVKSIEFEERPPGFYGAEDPMRQRGELAWRYKGLE